MNPYRRHKSLFLLCIDLHRARMQITLRVFQAGACQLTVSGHHLADGGFATGERKGAPISSGMNLDPL